MGLQLSHRKVSIFWHPLVDLIPDWTREAATSVPERLRERTGFPCIVCVCGFVFSERALGIIPLTTRSFPVMILVLALSDAHSLRSRMDW